MTSSTYNLSADLTLMILMELESPTDLYSFIRTTKPIYQIFQNHKASVLSAVLHNAVHPATMKDLLLANRAYSVCSLSARREYIAGLPGRGRGRLTDEEYRKRRLQRVKGFLDSIPEGELKEDFRNLDTLYSLCKLWNLVNGFINDFAARALAEFREACLCGKGSRNVDWSGEEISSILLSGLERARLFRAFCRFEEYRRLYGGPDHVSERHDYSGGNFPQEEFKARYQPWELFEIISIHSYLTHQMTIVVQEVEDTIFAIFAENVERKGDHPKMATSLKSLDLYGLSMFDDRYNQGYQIDCMVELGLPFLKHLSTTDFSQRLMAMKNFANDGCCPTLETALETYIRTRRVKDESQVQENCEETTIEQLSRENPGYCFISSSDSRSERSLKKTGIIFWDQARLDMTPPGLFGSSNGCNASTFKNGDIFIGRTPPPSPAPSPPPRPTIRERLQSRVLIETLRQLEESAKYLKRGRPPKNSTPGGPTKKRRANIKADLERKIALLEAQVRGLQPVAGSTAQSTGLPQPREAAREAADEDFDEYAEDLVDEDFT
ncbi:uncharacterized protein BDZ99DRAFT_577160 [Mytilinidion resinicola]|uniref:Uncharacterized protein n=1 Tax=Mytilinidion resinicola TaxID=574789 RepID=A0A6A6XZU1_9PEZI|nr:uncharacterized protein BDZ99DRAFT_577160 [Mytilinidion resinicola]KAF2801919.1 hypothetical protein BDZ99DRAFT_577160 [Mytilinidion resinicola]